MNSSLKYILLACTVFYSFAEFIAEARLLWNGNGNEVKQQKSSVSPEEKIVGGEETIPGRYPYQVGLLQYRRNVCGGSLVAPEWVLSAAHCINSNCDLSTYKVDINRHDRSNNNETYEEINIDFVVKHPYYDDNTLGYDTIMMKLSNPSKYSPITLNDEPALPIDGSNVTVMGWGTISSGSDTSQILLEVEVDVVNNEQCSISYEESTISDDMLCASREGKDSCQGDSGGPLIIKGENATMDKQVGIVSWGFGCADPSYPGVYSRVSSGYDFIQTTMSCSISDEIDLSDCSEIICKDGFFTCSGRECDGLPNDGFNYSDCKVHQPSFLGDGYCDSQSYNKPECNYDGGDCCKDTCDYELYEFCGPLSAFGCVDPESNYSGNNNAYPNDAFNYTYCSVAFPGYIGDGLCDREMYNTPECNYDGGDCCEDTCIDGPFFQCAECQSKDCFDCKDPQHCKSDIGWINKVFDIII